MEYTLKCEKIIREAGLTLSTAESCTGGLIAADIVGIAGCSDWFLEGCVTYTEEAKMTRLKVSADTIKDYTVVSGNVAEEMACGVRKNLNAKLGLATTGYAGPDGGDENNPVGTVYVGFSCDKGVDSIRLSLSGSRNEIRREAAKQAMKFLYRKLIEYYKDEKNKAM